MKRLLVVISLSCLANIAYAADNYIGAGVGQSKVSMDFGAIPANVSVSNDDTGNAWKIFGGHEFNKNIAVEVTYADFGKFSSNISGPGGRADIDWKANAFSVAGVGILPVQNNFKLFAKLGLAHWTLKDTATSTFGLSGSDSASGNDPMLGVGAEYDTQNLMLRIEYEKYTSVGDTDTTGQSDVDVIGVSAGVHF